MTKMCCKKRDTVWQQTDENDQNEMRKMGHIMSRDPN